MNHDRPSMRMTRQRGGSLLESLVAILIFSSGVIGMMGLQATAIRATSDAQYRTEAMFAANKVIARMWMSDPTTREDDFKSSSPLGAGYIQWQSEVIGVLAGVSTSTNAPTIVFDGTNPEQVTVTVRWQLPGVPLAHQYITTAEISLE